MKKQILTQSLLWRVYVIKCRQPWAAGINSLVKSRHRWWWRLKTLLNRCWWDLWGWWNIHNHKQRGWKNPIYKESIKMMFASLSLCKYCPVSDVRKHNDFFNDQPALHLKSDLMIWKKKKIKCIKSLKHIHQIWFVGCMRSNRLHLSSVCLLTHAFRWSLQYFSRKSHAGKRTETKTFSMGNMQNQQKYVTSSTLKSF